MKVKEKDLYETLKDIDTMLSCVMHDIDTYMENPQNYGPEYFRSVGAAAADARLLLTWVRDQLSYGGQDE